MDPRSQRALERAYKFLGLPSSADISEVRNAYKTLAIRIHPDKVAVCDRRNATAEFQKLQAAYEICLPHATLLAALNSRRATCEDAPDDDASDTHSGCSDHEFVFVDGYDDSGFWSPVATAARKHEKLFGDMVEAKEIIIGTNSGRARGANSQARWTAEQKLEQHRRSYAANGRLDGDVKKSQLSAAQRHKLKKAKEKRKILEEAAFQEKAFGPMWREIKQAHESVRRKEAKKEVDTVPDSW